MNSFAASNTGSRWSTTPRRKSSPATPGGWRAPPRSWGSTRRRLFPPPSSRGCAPSNAITPPCSKTAPPLSKLRRSPSPAPRRKTTPTPCAPCRRWATETASAPGRWLMAGLRGATLPCAASGRANWRRRSRRSSSTSSRHRPTPIRRSRASTVSSPACRTACVCSRCSPPTPNCWARSPRSWVWRRVWPNA